MDAELMQSFRRRRQLGHSGWGTYWWHTDMASPEQAFPSVPAGAWERSAPLATTPRPGPNTQATPARRPQAPTARRANRRWPHPAVIAAGVGATAAFATAAAILFAPTAAAKSGEYGHVCTGPHNIIAATCQPGALQQVPLGGATPEGCRRTGPVSTACGRRTHFVDPTDAGGAPTTLPGPEPGGATSTPALSGGAPSTVTRPQSSTWPNSASSQRFSPTHTQALHATSHR
jgi:hypothetical protein